MKVLLALLSMSLTSLVHSAEPTVIPLWPEGVPDALATSGEETNDDGRVGNVQTPTLTVVAPDPGKANGTSIIICPGGGYQFISFKHEGLDVAAWLKELGVTSFILKYRFAPNKHPAPLRDALRAVRIVRSRAAELGLDPARIGMLGSSAGGHLTASAGTLFDDPSGKTGAALDAVSGRPDFLVLMYPVITMKDSFAHAGSRRNLLGTEPAAADLALMSLEDQVKASTPPTFVFHTQEDKSVPVENSLMFYAAMNRAGVPGELHVYQQGRHGLGLAQGSGTAEVWPQQTAAWLKQLGFLPAK